MNEKEQIKTAKDAGLLTGVTFVFFVLSLLVIKLFSWITQSPYWIASVPVVLFWALFLFWLFYLGRLRR